ncbi:MAG: flagellar biosynthesis regulator FlaF [Devosiaceae bacterium]|nr:flagellar biosynthesis regulator FlaF [Devosiaceae bacterium]
MQQQATEAYQQAAKQTSSQSELEAHLLSKSARDLKEIQSNWESSKSDLDRVLIHNRKLWTIFLESVTRQDSPLPREIRQNVANLGIFVMNETMRIQSAPAPEKLEVLININRQIALGLLDDPKT